MIVGDGLAARPIPAAKYEFRQCWRVFRALIGVALLTTGTLALSSGARPATFRNADPEKHRRKLH